MPKRKNAICPEENRIPYTGAVALEPSTTVTTKANTRLGRPQKSGESLFLVRCTLAIYVAFLKKKAPKKWNKRTLNFVLFSPETPRAEWSRKAPYNGIGALLARKSMPRLWDKSQLSAGLLIAESQDMFAGGLQILFHPYWKLLHFPIDLFEIRFLLSHCKLTFSMGLMKDSNLEVSRNFLPAESEIASLDMEIAKAKKSAAVWERSFLDLLAIALALSLESQVIGDSDRISKWQDWWRRRELLFFSWPVGKATDRESLDGLVLMMTSNLSPSRFGTAVISYEYLKRHVLPSSKTTASSCATKDAGIWNEEFSIEKSIWAYLSIQEGGRPYRRELNKRTLNALQCRPDTK